MALHFTVPELKIIRNAYSAMGIENSQVLDDLKEIIRLSHFSSDSIKEITDEISRFIELTEDRKMAMSAEMILAKAGTIEAIQDKAQMNKKHGKQVTA